MSTISESRQAVETSWKVLIVDDEPQIHLMTKTVLRNFRFDDKPLHFLSAYNSEETKKILEEEDDIALILLDVVMETDDAGLKLVKYIRENLENYLTRIILRTGQPGQAPERQVITDYEINDYKEKIDLTSSRLFIAIVKSLKSYQTLKQMRQINEELEQSRLCFSQLIEASSKLFAVRDLDTFYSELTAQVPTLLGPVVNAMVADIPTGKILAAGGKWREKTGLHMNEVLNPSLLKEIDYPQERSLVGNGDKHFVCRFNSARETDYRLIIDGIEGCPEDSEKLLEVFCGNANIVFSNLVLEEDALATQSEMIELLGDVVENRSQELQGHVHRVSDYAVFLARKAGIPEEDIVILKNAVPMHDIGKIGIVDSILLKPGKLSEEEYAIMKTHTTIGYEILKFSSYKLFQMAAIIAREHHEQWDGNGYPRGLSGEDIHILGRITCLVDVFDALTSDRVYRKAWTFDRTMEYIREGRGKNFDPHLVDLFLEDPGPIRKIMIRYKDQ